jgi:murein DD-endopeptidase MepM/ murein hydrolase activator NlpD
MSRLRFKYNPGTLRFERARISVLNILITLVGYLAMGAVFFIGLILLQNYVIESPREKELTSENKALKQHKLILSNQLVSYNHKLAELKKEDFALYNQIFETTDTQNQKTSSPDKVDILVANTASFNNWITNINRSFSGVMGQAIKSNQFFSKAASVDKTDLSRLFNIPSIVPVENFEVNKLVSGFGTRINPFHKGNYHHDGIDIAAARGTLVLAAGHGEVISVKRSDMVAGYGNYIEIDHGHGVVTRYSHLDYLQVKVGQRIRKGQAIGTVGSSGGSIAPHLHYEVMVNGIYTEPIKFFMENLTADQFKEVVSRSQKMNQSLD